MHVFFCEVLDVSMPTPGSLGVHGDLASLAGLGALARVDARRCPNVVGAQALRAARPCCTAFVGTNAPLAPLGGF
jgi:hypothetical protein